MPEGRIGVCPDELLLVRLAHRDMDEHPLDADGFGGVALESEAGRIEGVRRSLAFDSWITPFRIARVGGRLRRFVLVGHWSRPPVRPASAARRRATSGSHPNLRAMRLAGRGNSRKRL